MKARRLQQDKAADFCKGIHYYSDTSALFEKYCETAAIAENSVRISSSSDASSVYQTMLLADALRYLSLQMCASKSSGHIGGFASQAPVIASLIMLGQKNILTEGGHHAPGFYSSLFLDGSLEEMGIQTIEELCNRFREKDGLLGHLSGAVPGVLAPAGPLGQGQHFAMAAAFLHRQTLFPVTIGDGGLDEPYVMSSIQNFHTAFPQVTNFLPILVWNGFSQEHHSMVAAKSNAEMIQYWRTHGFKDVVLIDAKEFDDAGTDASFVDSTAFPVEKRLAFMQAVLAGVERAIQSSLSGRLTVFIIKQLKGAGSHARGAKSHNLHPVHTLETPEIAQALQALALPEQAWRILRTNCERAAGGPASQVVVTETQRPLSGLALSLQEFPVGEAKKVVTAELGRLAASIGARDPFFIVANADGNEASGMANVNEALKIVHPVQDALYHQSPKGQVYEPISEDACAGLTAALALLGGRSLWCTYESFAVNGLPIWQTTTQAMAELRRSTPSVIAALTATAPEQARNGWTHQRPEIEAYLAAMMRNGTVYALFPSDANSIQVCYQWALESRNKGVAIIASKTPTVARMTIDQARVGMQEGAVVLSEVAGSRKIVFAVVGDLILEPVFEAAARLQAQGYGTRVVSILNPRRLLRAREVAWQHCHEPDSLFLEDDRFGEIFGGDAILGVTAGASALLDPILLRCRMPSDSFAWRRGETAASTRELLHFNDLSSESLAARALELISTAGAGPHVQRERPA